MKITYRNIDDFSKNEIILENAVDIRINGIKVEEIPGGINVNTKERLTIYPLASNSADITETKF